MERKGERKEKEKERKRKEFARFLLRLYNVRTQDNNLPFSKSAVGILLIKIYQELAIFRDVIKSNDFVLVDTTTTRT